MRKQQVPFNPPNLDSCPVTQELRRIKKELAEERRKDPKKFDARTIEIAKEWGLKIIDENHPFHKEVLEKRRRRLAAEKAEQESRGKKS